MAGASAALKKVTLAVAKPFSAIPGPKLYPLLGNLPQVITKISRGRDKFGVLLHNYIWYFSPIILYYLAYAPLLCSTSSDHLTA